MSSYDIIATLNGALDTFNNTSVNVVPSLTDDQGKRYLAPEDNGYQFSQRKMLADIDLAYNSIYKQGKYDREGQRKLYLNIVRFYVNVAVKNTDIDIKNFVFTPSDYTKANIWSTWFFKRQFSRWVKDEGYSKTINDLNFDFNKYGTCVSKKVKNDIVRVPIRSIKCDQAAETLMDGIRGGTPMIQEHEFSYVQMKDFKEWDITESFTGKRIVYEMYSYMPRCELLKLQKKTVTDKEDDTMVFTMAIIMPTGRQEEDKRKKYDDKVLFIEETTEADFPFNESHSEKQDGRWLGRGNVENQLENQIARNLSANLRRRSMLWASKQIFQTQGDVVNKNLVKNVQDGEVLQVGLNGLISKVDTSSRALSDFSQDEQVWAENSDKQAFAFESATGETPPSGTPFRLQALLSNTVMSYFDRQKEIFGLYLQDTFFQQIIPIFAKQAKDDIATIAKSSEGYKEIMDLFVELQSNRHYAALALSPDIFEMKNVPSYDVVKQHIAQEIVKSPYLFVELTKDMYKNAKYTLDLDITGEQKDPADKETLTTLYTTLAQKGDPRAEDVLQILLASLGKNLNAIAGAPSAPSAPSAPAQSAVNPVNATAQNPNLAGLTPNATQ